MPKEKENAVERFQVSTVDVGCPEANRQLQRGQRDTAIGSDLRRLVIGLFARFNAQV
jgi:hypothetical protein